MKKLELLNFFKPLRLIGLSALMLAAVHGATTTKSSPVPTPGPSLTDYVVRPGDVIAISILNEDKLNGQMSALKIAKDNTVTLPLLEEPLNLSGKTVREIQQMVIDRYKPDYLKNPFVNVRVVETALRTVNVTGQVNHPSQIPIPPERGLKLWDAITQAGGLTRIARPSRVSLTRTNADGKKETFIIDAEEINKHPDGKNDWPLQPDDFIDIPEIIM